MIYFLISIVIVISALSLWALLVLKGKLKQSEKEKQLLSEKMQNMEMKVGEEMRHISTTVITQMGNLQRSFDDRLKDNTQKLDTRLDNAAKSFAQVHSELSRVQESNKHIRDLAKDISSLQEILRSPKLRGNLGEYFLGDLLAQIFPKQNYSIQHTVDAIIRLKGGCISVDSKFPLENFKRIVESQDETEMKQWKKSFVQDVKKHIDAIAKKYILPNEGTLDFALMYIPAENVYYETIIKDEDEKGLMQHAFEKRVIPVSPNTFYVYINTIMLGLKGMQIEEHAKSIMDDLKRLMKDQVKFRQDFDVLGRHITDSKNKFDTADRRLEKFENQLGKAAAEELSVAEDLQKIDQEA
jgi:DNA recombination protein RmuC